MLSVEMLTAIMPTLARAKAVQYLPFLVAGIKEFRIDNELRISAFLAMLAEESEELTHWEENLSYSAQRLHEVWPKRFPSVDSAAAYAHDPEKLANKVYGGRADLGNTEPGDGWKFHGRGPIQTTGRGLYEELSDLLAIDLVGNPEKINDLSVAFRAAAAIFARIKSCNVLSDALITNPNNLRIITKRINGGYNGLAQRLEYYRRARKALPDNIQLSGTDVVFTAPKTDAGDSGNGSTVLEPEEPAGSTNGPQNGPPNMDVETGKVEDPSPVAAGPSTEPAAKPLWDRFSGFLGRTQEKLDKVTSFQNSLSPISGSSRATFLLTKILGWFVLAAGFIRSNWIWFVGGIVLVGFAIWYLAQAKKNANARSGATNQSQTQTVTVEK